MIRISTGGCLRLGASLLLVGLVAAGPAAAQQPAGRPGEPNVNQGPTGNEPDLVPDTESATSEGFELLPMGEHRSDPRTEVIRREFIVPIEKAAGQDGTHPFDYALRDLNGDGLADVVLMPRAPGLGIGERFEGVRTLVFVLDEDKSWRKVLDAGAQEVAYRRSKNEAGEDVHDLALIQPSGFYQYRWDGQAFVEVRS